MTTIKRDDTLKRDLPKHLYLDGSSYRTKLPDGRRLTLGTNKDIAIQRLNVLLSKPVQVDATDGKVLREIWLRHRKGAKQRGLDFSIEVQDIADIVTRQGNRCAVTLLPFRDDKPEGLRVRPWAPSLDRISSSKGYVPGNVRVVCGFVNVAMNGFGDDFFSAVLEPLVQARVSAELTRLGIT